jgi:hypothetical protein
MAAPLFLYQQFRQTKHAEASEEMQTSIYSTLIHEILAQGHTDVHGQIPDTN